MTDDVYFNGQRHTIDQVYLYGQPISDVYTRMAEDLHVSRHQVKFWLMLINYGASHDHNDLDPWIYHLVRESLYQVTLVG